jgi:hypothetical protein
VRRTHLLACALELWLCTVYYMRRDALDDGAPRHETVDEVEVGHLGVRARHQRQEADVGDQAGEERGRDELGPELKRVGLRGEVGDRWVIGRNRWEWERRWGRGAGAGARGGGGGGSSPVAGRPL